MKLIMITRKVDRADHLAGFTYDWVVALSKQVEHLTVITWQKSQTEGLPENVELVSLPNNKLFKIAALKLAILKRLPKIDGVFCHMNPEYTLIAGPIARLFGKKVVAWYTHSSVTWKTRLLEKIATRVVTASAESFRLPSKKVSIIGHGINVDKFKPFEQRKENLLPMLLSVGRISPTKDYESMILAVRQLKKQGTTVNLQIVGGVGLKRHQNYYQSLQEMVKKMQLESQVIFLGPQPHTEVPNLLQNADYFINLSGTGSIDKAVLEAMASGCIPITANEAFKKILPEKLLVEQNNPKQLAECIEQLLAIGETEKNQLHKKLRAMVVEKHNLNELMKKIIAVFKL